MDLAHLGGPEAGDAEHLCQAGRHLLAQLVERARAARGQELRAGGVLHGTDASGVLPLDHEERGELVERLADGVLIHACPINLTAQS